MTSPIWLALEEFCSLSVCPKTPVSIADTEYLDSSIFGVSRFPAYSAVSNVKTPQTACKYREQAVYEVVLTGIVDSEMGGR
jgi:hypothetical protein